MHIGSYCTFWRPSLAELGLLYNVARDTEDMGVRMGQGVAEMYHAQVCHAMHTEL